MPVEISSAPKAIDKKVYPNDQLLQRSEITQEIISDQHGFIEKWALLIFSIIILLIIVSSWFIKYPDLIQAPAVLTAANGPKEIICRQEGKLTRLFVHNDDTVSQGDLIAWMESTGDHTQVINLSALLYDGIDLIQKNETGKVSRLFEKSFQDLGELQSSYQQFIAAWQQFNDYLINGYYFKKKRALDEDYNYLKKIHETFEKQKHLVEQDVQLTQDGFEANNSLYNDKIISKQDLRDQKSKLLGKQMILPQLESVLLQNESQQLEKRKDIDELEHSILQQKIIFRQELQTLKSLTDLWIQKYTIKAATSGKVVFVMPLQENQYLQTNKLLGYINPSDSYFYAQVNLVQHNFGKIDTGQKVQLRFEAYPFQEFGFIEGKLTYISKVPSDSGFLANVELPVGLVTNLNKEIQYKNGLKAQAIIITKDVRLLQKFYYNIAKNIHQ
jgi:HlyD family secretion protein